jgi:hypothetical protein
MNKINAPKVVKYSTVFFNNRRGDNNKLRLVMGIPIFFFLENINFLMRPIFGFPILTTFNGNSKNKNLLFGKYALDKETRRNYFARTNISFLRKKLQCDYGEN